MLRLRTGSPLARLGALAVTASLLAPTLAGCGGQPAQQAPIAPPSAQQRPAAQPARQGMTTKQKLVLVAGAAALYYIYKKRQNAKQQTGAGGKYYRSESTGRVYYRYPDGKFQWVSPPTQPIQVPESEARQYGLNGYQGYNNSREGQEFGGYGYGNTNPRYTDAEPAQTF